MCLNHLQFLKSKTFKRKATCDISPKVWFFVLCIQTMCLMTNCIFIAELNLFLPFASMLNKKKIKIEFFRTSCEDRKLPRIKQNSVKRITYRGRSSHKVFNDFEINWRQGLFGGTGNGQTEVCLSYITRYQVKEDSLSYKQLDLFEPFCWGPEVTVDKKNR